MDLKAGMKRGFICINMTTPGWASEQGAVEQHTGHVTSLPTVDVMTPHVLYRAKFVHPEV